MNFGGHLLASWWLANVTARHSATERRVITLMGLLPDIDGVCTFIQGLGHLHRTFGHNLWLLLSAPLLATFLFISPPRRLFLYPILFSVISLHYVMDIFATGWWPLMPLWPLSEQAFYMDRYIPQYIMKYYIQIGLFVILLLPTVLIFLRYKRTPLAVLSAGLDRFFQDFIILPWTHKCQYCQRRAFYKCAQCGEVICGVHRKFGANLRPQCSPECGFSTRTES